MFRKIMGLFSNDLSIDLGTANTLIYVRGKGMVLNEPSAVAIRTNEHSSKPRSIVAVGEDAKDMLGRENKKIKTVRPLRDGVIADFEVTEKMLQSFIRKVHKARFFQPSPRVLICVPCGSTQVERRAIRESASGAGAREVYLIEEPMAAAIGAGMPVSEPIGSMVIDIGGGTTEVATLSLNGIVWSDSVKVGGDRFDDAIIKYIRRNHGIVIAEPTAEKIKKKIGTAYHMETPDTMEVHGINATSQTPRSFVLEIDSNEVLEALQEPLVQIVSAVRNALEFTPPELGADIAEHGIVLTGGGALLRNLNTLLSEETGIPVIIADDPLTCVARGGGRALEMMDEKGIDIFSFE